MRFEDYCGRFESIALRRVDGIVEMRIHQRGGMARWDFDASGLHAQLGDAFAAVAGDPDVRAVILTGTGPDFLTELDFGEGEPEPMDSRFLNRIYAEGMSLLQNHLAIPVPMIAAVNGRAFIHAELAVLCDIVLASPDASFSDKAHFVAGSVPGDGVHVVWPMLLGANRGRYFLLTGQEIGAEEARRLGIVAEVVAADGLLPRAWELAREIASKPALVTRFTRRLLVDELRTRMAARLSEGLLLECMALLP